MLRQLPHAVPVLSPPGAHGHHVLEHRDPFLVAQLLVELEALLRPLAQRGRRDRRDRRRRRTHAGLFARSSGGIRTAESSRRWIRSRPSSGPARSRGSGAPPRARDRSSGRSPPPSPAPRADRRAPPEPARCSLRCRPRRAGRRGRSGASARHDAGADRPRVPTRRAARARTRGSSRASSSAPRRAVRSRRAEQALVEEGGERVEIRVADGLRRLERAAAAEHAEPREQLLLGVVEQVVRPGDRRPERRVALLGVPGSLQRVEPVGEAVEERLGREQLRPGGGELERERQAVEPVAELNDGVGGG